MLPPVVDNKTFFLARNAESQQLARSQKGGGYVYQGIRRQASSPAKTFQPLVTRSQFTRSLLKRAECISSFQEPGTQDPEIVSKVQTHYQGLSSLKQTTQCDTQTFFFNKPILRQNSSIHSEVSTDGGKSMLNNIWRQAQQFENVTKNVEKFSEPIMTKLAIPHDQHSKVVSRKIKQTFQRFKIHDPLNLKSQDNVTSLLRSQARKKPAITKLQKIFQRPNVNARADAEFKLRQQEIIKLLQEEAEQAEKEQNEGSEVAKTEKSVKSGKSVKPISGQPPPRTPPSQDGSTGAEMEINFEDTANDVEKKIDYVAKNKKILTTKRDMIQKLHLINRELSQQNIPSMLQHTNFSRYELHTTYNLYMGLQQITSQRYRFYNTDDGIDYDTFRNGIYQVSVQSEELARKIFAKIDFNYSGFLNWSEFLDLMVIIRAKTLKEKIDLFIKIADEDGNGSLSKDEIFNLSKICLSRYVRQDTEGGEEFLDLLCEYFTRLIFESVDIDIDDEIPMDAIKEAILSGNKESDLLCMFCGADM